MRKEEKKEEIIRVRIPRDKEIFGIVAGRAGAARFFVLCADNKERLCRIPGKIKHRIWVKDNDIVLIEPWVIEGDKRGDIVWRYTKIQSDWLKRQGYLKDLSI